MTVGIPGTGVGGLFYLAAALLLPFRTMGRALGARRAVLKAAVRQASIAVAIFGSMWLTGWCVGALLGPALQVRGSMLQRFAAANQSNLIQWAVLLFGYLLLGTLLLVVQVARVVVKRRPSRSRPSGEHRRPVAAMR